MRNFEIFLIVYFISIIGLLLIYLIDNKDINSEKEMNDITYPFDYKFIWIVLTFIPFLNTYILLDIIWDSIFN